MATEGDLQSTDLFRYVQTGVDETGKVQGFFAPTGKLPTFFRDFQAKGVPVPEEVFTKGSVKLKENGEPDLESFSGAVQPPAKPQ